MSKNGHIQQTIQSIITIAEIHAKRLKYAAKKLSHYFPLSAKAVETIPDEDIALFELYSNRFSKLQDLMGNALFPKLLLAVGEPSDEMTFIDKLNRLEKLGVIGSADIWMKMRQVRNHLSHEYPNQPDLTAEYLNQVFSFEKTLLDYLKCCIQFAEKHVILHEM